MELFTELCPLFSPRGMPRHGSGEPDPGCREKTLQTFSSQLLLSSTGKPSVPWSGMALAQGGGSHSGRSRGSLSFTSGQKAQFNFQQWVGGCLASGKLLQSRHWGRTAAMAGISQYSTHMGIPVLILCVSDRISCAPDWPPTSCESENDLEFLSSFLYLSRARITGVYSLICWLLLSLLDTS